MPIWPIWARKPDCHHGIDQETARVGKYGVGLGFQDWVVSWAIMMTTDCENHGYCFSKAATFQHWIWKIKVLFQSFCCRWKQAGHTFLRTVVRLWWCLAVQEPTCQNTTIDARFCKLYYYDANICQSWKTIWHLRTSNNTSVLDSQVCLPPLVSNHSIDAPPTPRCPHDRCAPRSASPSDRPPRSPLWVGRVRRRCSAATGAACGTVGHRGHSRVPETWVGSAD